VVIPIPVLEGIESVYAVFVLKWSDVIKAKSVRKIPAFSLKTHNNIRLFVFMQYVAKQPE
ncbi:hypothetical protein, partial [Escherichia coli]|uniref:hypothetical protein n=1 Tax=Escherichia coli TaxID=562 RepID=UPI001BDC80B4